MHPKINNDIADNYQNQENFLLYKHSFFIREKGKKSFYVQVLVF